MLGGDPIGTATLGEIPAPGATAIVLVFNDDRLPVAYYSPYLLRVQPDDWLAAWAAGDVAIVVSDIGAGNDTLAIAVGIAIADSGAGNDVGPVPTVNLAIADLGAGVEAIANQVLAAIADVAGGADFIDVSVSVPIADVAAGVDQPALAALLAIAESAGATDAIVRFDAGARIATITFKLAQRSVSFDFTARSISFAMN